MKMIITWWVFMKNNKKAIPWFKPNFWGKEKEYSAAALDSTWISDGEFVVRFEEIFAGVLAVRNAITVANGTAALQLALLSLELKPGDEVIIPGYTFAAPVNMTLAVGAKAIIADVNPDTWCLSAEEFAKNITKKTKAVIPVHIYGNVCDMKLISEVAAQHNIAVIEDVAEAAFSKYSGKYAGSLGDVGCFSFQATKTIAMGEGGALVTNNDLLFNTAKLIRNHGMRPEKRYWHEVVGHNFRLTNMQAALGCAQLECMEQIIKNKQRVYHEYKKRLQLSEIVVLQQIPAHVDPVIWAFAIKIVPERFKYSRDKIIQKLKEQGIETRTGFYSFGQMPLYGAPNLDVADTLSKNIISLPSYPTLTETEIDHICDCLLGMGI